MIFCCKLFGHEKVSILNGGFSAWTKHGYTMQIETQHFKVKYRRKLFYFNQEPLIEILMYSKEILRATKIKTL